MGKILTIVLPTYNRKDYLVQTLALFEPQVKRNAGEVRFIISNNASDDGTDAILEDLYGKSPFFDYVNYKEHVEVGLSIYRTCDLAETDYVLMWGDDDYPFPYTVDIILDTLKAHPEVSLIHYNRLHGKDAGCGMKDLSMQKAVIGSGIERVIPVKKCIDNYIMDMSFLTTNVFKKSYWDSNKDLDCSLHYGYEFLGRILHGMKDDNAVYIEFPLCIQRKPAYQKWVTKSPLYRFIGMPNMYKDFEKWGLTDDAKALWMVHGNRFDDFLAVISQAAFAKSMYRPMFREIISHEYTFLRKAICFFFIFLCPEWLSRLARGIKYN